MKINEKLIEQPNHAHYLACLQRKKDIEKFCRKIFFFSIAESAVFAVMIMFGLWLSALSWIPSLCGEPFTIPNIFAYAVEIILLPVIAFAGCGKYKICTVIFFAIQCIIVIGCFLGGFRTVNTFPFLIGIIGSVTASPSISAYLDYRQLMHTEGFPQFNNLLADTDDNPEFVSDYSKQYYSNENKDFIPVPEKTNPNIQPVSTSEKIYMDDL